MMPPLLFRVFQRFFKLEAAGGIVLMACAVVALVWANSPWAAGYSAFWNTKLTIGIKPFQLSESLLHWINDGLMTLFFFVVGLEIKRELLCGELASAKRAALPVMAALGGMLAPAALYACFNAGQPSARGWGIPMATDIAFSLGVLALLGRRVPFGLKIFLAALAIADDLGAVLVIALFYTETLSFTSLAIAGAFCVALFGINRRRVSHPLPYLLLGLGLWLAVLNSGVHATISGVLVAIAVPSRPNVSRLSAPELKGLAAPLSRFEEALHPWVSFGIMPLFALANAGVALAGEAHSGTGQSVSQGVIAGLVLGKPIGIVLLSWIAVRLGVAVLPEGVQWRHLLGVGMLAGIGFTMSLFVASLAFGIGPLLDAAKAGILVASLASGLCGGLVLLATSLRRAPAAQPAGAPVIS